MAYTMTAQVRGWCVFDGVFTIYKNNNIVEYVTKHATYSTPISNHYAAAIGNAIVMADPLDKQKNVLVPMDISYSESQCTMFFDLYSRYPRKFREKIGIKLLRKPINGVITPLIIYAPLSENKTDVVDGDGVVPPGCAELQQGSDLTIGPEQLEILEIPDAPEVPDAEPELPRAIPVEVKSRELLRAATVQFHGQSMRVPVGATDADAIAIAQLLDAMSEHSLILRSYEQRCNCLRTDLWTAVQQRDAALRELQQLRVSYQKPQNVHAIRR